MYKSTLLFALLSVAVVFAQLPQLPTQFSANVQITNNLAPMPVSGVMYYDYDNQMQLVNSKDPFFGQVMATLDRWDLGNNYQYSPSQRQCECKQESSGMAQMQIGPGFVNVGTDYVNGVECDAWELTLFGGVVVTNYVDSSDNTVLVRSNMTVNQMGQIMTTLMDFSNVVEGPSAFPSGIFNVPSYCQCPTPPPPPPPAHYSCPSNPPQGCSCVSKPLSFCNLVNYPIFDATTAPAMDSFVQQTYNTFVAASNPTASCAANIKQFLCATTFALCVDGIVPVLPCWDTCPLCSCGESAGTCTGTNSTICTSYGNSMC